MDKNRPIEKNKKISDLNVLEIRILVTKINKI